MKIPISLSEYQSEHVKAIKRILSTSFHALDMSKPGTGKRYTTSTIADELGLNVISIASHKTKWNHMKKVHGVPLIHNISYTQLKSCELLNNFGQIVKKGVLLVIHGIELNKIHSSHPIILLIQEIESGFRQGCKSRVLLVSNSAFDKENHALNFFRAINVLTETNLLCKDWNPFSGANPIDPGMKQIFDYCQSILDSSNMCYKIQRGFLYNDKTAKQRAHKLFNDIVKKKFSNSIQ